MLKHLLIAGLLAGTVIIPNTEPGQTLIMPNGDIIMDTGTGIVTKDGMIVRTPNPIDQQNQQEIDQFRRELREKSKN